ncbi:MAG: hypothetical protein GKR90_13595 [Pseudomonadales bacterium]|nr:hypothetical protein [Pseudomonadales bacterium]
MADIAMCFGRDCDKRKDCYRYRAMPDSSDQTYGTFDLSRSAESHCDFYWAIELAEGASTERSQQRPGPCGS